MYLKAGWPFMGGRGGVRRNPNEKRVESNQALNPCLAAIFRPKFGIRIFLSFYKMYYASSRFCSSHLRMRYHAVSMRGKPHPSWPDTGYLDDQPSEGELVFSSAQCTYTSFYPETQIGYSVLVFQNLSLDQSRLKLQEDAAVL